MRLFRVPDDYELRRAQIVASITKKAVHFVSRRVFFWKCNVVAGKFSWNWPAAV
jgi:hypothetical protein